AQFLSEYALHVLSFVGLPVGLTRQYRPTASVVILPQLTRQNVAFGEGQKAIGAHVQLSVMRI
ncbi:phosphoribosylglycinamide formyltransferase 2, partial [Escherichia coli]|nr:phosphoribosylglycinamide formyltransferase 2 [Escherichia coli]